MKNFRRLCLAVIVIAAFSMPALAGETQGPGCANPGETQSPPGETQTPPCLANPDTQESGYTGIAQTPGYPVIAEVDTPAFETVLFLVQAVF